MNTSCHNPIYLIQFLRYFYLNYTSADIPLWSSAFATSFSSMNTIANIDPIRFAPYKIKHRYLLNAGWHYSYSLGFDTFVKKKSVLRDSIVINSKELSSSDFDECLASGLDIYGRNISWFSLPVSNRSHSEIASYFSPDHIYQIGMHKYFLMLKWRLKISNLYVRMRLFLGRFS